MKLDPTLNRLIIKPTAVAPKPNASGIIIAPSATKEHNKPELGTVVAAGPGAYHPKTGELIKMTAIIGDTVLFSRMSGQVIAFGEQEVVSVFEHDIIGIVRS